MFSLVTTVGSAAAVAGLAAAVTRRGRRAGIVAAIVGVLAPVLWIIAMAVVLFPVISALAP